MSLTNGQFSHNKFPVITYWTVHPIQRVVAFVSLSWGLAVFDDMLPLGKVGKETLTYS